ncbi:MAG: hypothetical protein IPM32_09325 [Ignavibacteriae bacterium]|nr:hypothetical protein [Ignavibacteriota bacterium]
MIPDNITHSHLIQAIKRIKVQGYDPKRKSRDYDLYFGKKRYPPKIVVEYANEIAGNAPIEYHSGGIEHDNEYLQKKGFVIIGKNNKPEDEFFNEHEIQFLLAHSFQRYSDKSDLHKTISNLFNNSLFPKTDRWASEVIPNKFELVKHHRYLKRDSGFMRIQGYTWASFFPKGKKDKNIYFTVGIHANTKVFKPGLIYKIDYQKDGLSNEQSILFDELYQKYNLEPITIPISNLKSYTWEKLFEESKKYFDDNIENLNKLIIEVWNDSIPKKKIGGPKVETKICRLCWNTNSWIKPSGRLGKAKTKSHELEFGFGHEEWLFDFDKIIDGYKYAFLEPVRKFQKKYEGEKFNILLYSIDGKTKQKYWIGKINNLEVISDNTAKIILQKFEENSWLNEMEEDLINLGIDPKVITNKYIEHTEILNVRFKRKDCEIFSELVPIIDNSIITSTRYNLLNLKDGFGADDIKFSDKQYDPNSGSTDVSNLSKKYKKTFEKREIELNHNHNILTETFFNHLKSAYPNDTIRNESTAHGQARIDIVRQTQNGDIFYELKTYNNFITSLRVAFGQLFEYCFYPNAQNAIKLVLVTDTSPKQQEIEYVKHLNDFIKIPFEIIYFNTDTKTIEMEIKV